MSSFPDILDKRMQTLRPPEDFLKKIHEQGRLSAQERLEKLLDKDSFIPLHRYITHRATGFGMETKKAYGDGVLAGLGTVNGRKIAVYAQDFSFMGGSVGEMHASKIARTIELALKLGVPLVGLNDSGGARIQEGVDSLKGYGEIFYRNVLASGVVPQIVAIMGPAAGGAVYSPALADFIIMTRKSYMFITGPKVVKASIGEEVTFEELGGAEVHATKSGVAHFLAENDDHAIEIIKTLLSYLPSNNTEDPPCIDTGDDPFREDPQLDSIVPEDPLKPYDVKEVIDKIFDKGSFLEVHALFATNAVVGFARLGGCPVCVVANQPAVAAGSLDIDSADKISRFVMFCDAFNFPIVTLVDVPGFLPGTFQEHGGVIRHGAKIIYAYSEATVPKITVIMRKAYGGAYIAMSSRHLGADYVLAWPTAEIAVMGPKEAIEIIYKKELEKAQNPEELAKEFAEKYRREITTPFFAASRGYVDDVILPRETRGYIFKALAFLRDKREKHARPPRKHGIPPV